MAKRLKKERGLAILALALAGGLGMVGCGSDDSSPDNSQTSTTGGEDGGASEGGHEEAGTGGDAKADAGGTTGGGSTGASSDGGKEAGTSSEAGTTGTTGDGGHEGGATGDGGHEGGATGDGGHEGGTATAGSDGGASDGGITTAPHANFPTAAISFGTADCGAAAAVTKTLTVQNTGNAPLTVTAAASGSGFSVSPATQQTVAPNQSTTFTISASVPTSATAGTALAGTLTVTTNDTARASTSINLSVVPHGGALAWDTGSPTNADFGDAPNNQDDTPISLTLRNVGNADLNVTFGAPSNNQFSLDQAGHTVPMAANATQGLVAGFHPTTLNPSTATSQFTVTGVVCGGSVSQLAFSGRGGVGLVSGFPTSTIDFGPAICGNAPSGQSFTLHNAGSVPVHITTATLTGTAGYATDALNGVIPANGDLVVHVTAPAIPFPSPVPASYDGTLTLRTDAVNDSADHVINLTERSQGAILAWNVPDTFGSFGSVTVQDSASQQFTLVNSGNDGSNVTLTTDAPFGVDAAQFVIGAGAAGSHNGTATFSPTVIGGANGTLAINATNLCAPAPSPLSLTGLGTNGGIAIVPNSLSFADNCGSTPTGRTFTIQNTGNVDMTWSASLGLGDASGFTIDTNSATLHPSETSTVTVTPKPVSVNPAVLSDQVKITTTGIVGDGPHFVDVSETPVGDVIVVASDTFRSPGLFNFGSRPVPSTGTVSYTNTFTVKNNANFASSPATVSLTLTENDVSDGPVHFSISPSGPLTLAPGDQQTVTVTFTLSANSSEAGDHSGSIAIGTGDDVLCANTNIATINLTGTGTLAQVDIPPAVSFGHVNCGGTAAPKNLTVTNTGNQDFTITGVTLAPVVNEAPLYFSIPNNLASTVVAAGTTFNIPIQPLMIPQTVSAVTNSATNVDDSYSANVTITTDAALDSPHLVALTMGPRGAIITNNLDSRVADYTFPPTPFGQSFILHVPIANSGNAPVTLSFNNQTTPGIFSLFPNNPSATDPSATFPDNFDFGFKFTPSAAGQDWSGSGTLVVTADAFCQPLPQSWVNAPVLLKGSSPVATP